MQKYIPLLKKVTLFENIKDSDMLAMLKCLGARIHSYKKGEILLMAGDTVSSVGIVLSGQAHVVREDIDGNQMIITELTGMRLVWRNICLYREPNIVRSL
ncbi:MAG: cyclic nucleotide-binding domain-containing protein [Acutalibacteraceae bacterium]